MKMKITQPYFNKLNVLNVLEININTEKLTHDIDMSKLFTVAVRRNKKRIFLFVSKVLGKHVAIDPLYVRLAGVLLADSYNINKQGVSLQKKELETLFNNDKLDRNSARKIVNNLYPLNQKTLFIGFAETATGLGHSMFRAFEGNATFIHTTREPIISEEPTFIFEEEHSHATSHACYTKDEHFFEKFDNIVLVDDEVTTGNTALNLIEALHKKCGARKYSVVAILDWRNKEQIDKASNLEKKLNIEIDFISIVKGDMKYQILKELNEKDMIDPELLNAKKNDIYVYHYEKTINKNINKVTDESISKEINKSTYKEIDNHEESLVTIKIDFNTPHTCITKSEDNKVRRLKYIDANGRFGIETKQDREYDVKLEKIGEALKKYRISNRTLCLGTEEFIYIPARIAEAMGENVKYQSTTRSPILTIPKEEYPLNSVMAYHREEDKTVINYIYNILPNSYDEVFWFLERDYSIEFKSMIYNAFRKKGIKKVNFVCFADIAEEIYE